MRSNREQLKIRVAALERGPGPGRYGLPTTIGSNAHDVTKEKQPSHCMSRRFLDPARKRELGPGPAYGVHATMNHHGRTEAHKYTMGLALRPIIKTVKMPGPADYRTEDVHPQGHRHPEKYTIRIRTANCRMERTPAPNNYDIPVICKNSCKPCSPRYSIPRQSRFKDGHYAEDRANTPGPGTYTAMEPSYYKNRVPTYSIPSAKRDTMPEESNPTPAPNEYGHEMLMNKRRNPIFTMRIRHSEFIAPLMV